MSEVPSAPSSANLQADLYDSTPPADMLQARKVALQILQQVFVKKHTLDQAIDESGAFNTLMQRDRAFVRMLVTTVIRRLGQIDDLIRKSLSRPDQPINPPVLEFILRLGVAQLVFMNVPDHAAVNTSVQLVESEGHGRMKGFINALLRRISAEGKDWTTRQDIARLNTPEWLLKIWIEDYGLKGALDIAMANLVEPPLDITLKQPDTAEQWSKTLGAIVMPSGSLRLPQSKMVQELPGYNDGAWWVQDTAAAIPAQLFGTLLYEKEVVDLCAAPGGKTAQLASGGARVTAVDRSAKRLQRLQENMRRLRLSPQVRTEVADAAVWKSREPAQYILLDAPCSATGTVRRNPDVIWMKTRADVNSLVELQARLLMNAVNMLAPGGILIYCTCSLQKEEGEHQIERLLDMRDDVDRVPIQAQEVGGMPEIVTPRGDLRILPHHLAKAGGLDGFYVCRLRKHTAEY